MVSITKDSLSKESQSVIDNVFDNADGDKDFKIDSNVYQELFKHRSSMTVDASSKHYIERSIVEVEDIKYLICKQIAATMEDRKPGCKSRTSISKMKT